MSDWRPHGNKLASGRTKIANLHWAAGRCADKRRGTHGGGRCQAALPLFLVDAVAFCLGQLQEVLHGTQVNQQRLGRRLGVFLLTEDLREKALRERERK